MWCNGKNVLDLVKARTGKKESGARFNMLGKLLNRFHPGLTMFTMTFTEIVRLDVNFSVNAFLEFEE